MCMLIDISHYRCDQLQCVFMSVEEFLRNSSVNNADKLTVSTAEYLPWELWEFRKSSI